jgi:hypothetical protein
MNAEQWSGQAPGVYATLNPVAQELLARSVNRVVEYAKQTTSDANIIGRRWLPIDFDPVRAAGISSTDEEHEMALTRAREVALWLGILGFPTPILADSGNGAHLLEAIDLPNAPESTALIKRCLEALALRFSDSQVVVDLTTFNAAQIWKVYGTKACKGDATPERPHRMARLLEVPEKIEIVSVNLLKKLAALAPEEPKREQSYGGNGREPFDIDSFIARAGLEVAFADAWQGGRKWILKSCPWNSDHQNRSAFVLQFPSGAVTAGCHHNGCTGKGWADLREMFEPSFQRKKAQALTGSGTSREEFFVTMDTIQTEKVDWLWPKRIPFRRITMVDGDPGSGKTFFALAVAASVSTGKPLPGHVANISPAFVLLLSIEDGFADTVRPRLDALGADCSKIVIPNPKRGLAPSLLNASFIETAVKQVGPRLVVVDPVIAFAGKRNTDKAGDVRELLSPLMAMAGKYGFACLICRHFTKNEGSKALYRGAGSIDFMASARSAFLIVEDGTDGRRVLAHVKNSLGPKTPSREFFLYDEGGQARFKWGNEVNESAEELLQANAANSANRDRGQVATAREFIETALANGPMLSKILFVKAEAVGITTKSLYRAKEFMGDRVQARRPRGSKEWVWCLAT